MKCHTQERKWKNGTVVCWSRNICKNMYICLCHYYYFLSSVLAIFILRTHITSCELLPSKIWKSLPSYPIHFYASVKCLFIWWFIVQTPDVSSEDSCQKNRASWWLCPVFLEQATPGWGTWLSSLLGITQEATTSMAHFIIEVNKPDIFFWLYALQLYIVKERLCLAH